MAPFNMEIKMVKPWPWWYAHKSPYACPACGALMTWGEHTFLGCCDSCYAKEEAKMYDDQCYSQEKCNG